MATKGIKINSPEIIMADTPLSQNPIITTKPIIVTSKPVAISNKPPIITSRHPIVTVKPIITAKPVAIASGLINNNKNLALLRLKK